MFRLRSRHALRCRHALDGDHFIGTEHLLLGLLREEHSSAAKILHQMGLTLERARTAVIEHLKSKGK